jgi:hypothetical protein
MRHKIERAPQDAAEEERRGDTKQQACGSHEESAADSVTQYAGGRGAKGQANAEFLCAAFNEIGDSAENSHGDEGECDGSEAGYKNQIESGAAE